MNEREMIIAKEAEYVLGTYQRPPIVFTSGAGVWLYDSEGMAYLDFAAGIAVNALGQADPDVVRSIQDQAAKIGHVSNLYHTAPQAELAEMLCQTSFADKVFFTNSGAEAVEAAIKLARKYAQVQHGGGKEEIISFSGSFHGRTMGALALTAREKYQAPFRPLMPGATILPFNNCEAVEAAFSSRTCAVIVEPIQGEGGVHQADPAFMATLRTLCDKYDALLILDEIQCGMGRTGELWAYQHGEVTPDILTTAKALGGGLPIGAALMTDWVAAVMKPGDHGSTFAGGPIVCAAALTILSKVNAPEMLSHIGDMGKNLMTALTALPNPGIREIRGQGLMVGIAIDGDARTVVEKGYEVGILILNAGEDVIRLLPPYIITDDHIARVVTFLEEAL